MHALLTGAGRGIGYALAKELVKNKRITLYLISRSVSNLTRLKEECLSVNPEARIVSIPFDLRKLPESGLPPEIGCDHLDILINNAGALINKPFEELTTEDMMEMTLTNYLLPAMLIQKLIPRMGGETGSHVVNVSSMGGFQGSVKFPGLSLYSSGKAALASLTECLAAEFSQRNIVFNCLAIGAVQTEMLEAAFPGYQAPLTPESMAEFMAWFACNGQRYFQGKVLPVSVSTP